MTVTFYEVINRLINNKYTSIVLQLHIKQFPVYFIKFNFILFEKKKRQ